MQKKRRTIQLRTRRSVALSLLLSAVCKKTETALDGRLLSLKELEIKIRVSELENQTMQNPFEEPQSAS